MQIKYATDFHKSHKDILLFCTYILSFIFSTQYKNKKTIYEKGLK